MAGTEPVYERLGAKVLSLPDVIAQSVGFMGPVFSSAFVIPLVIGVISASGKGGRSCAGWTGWCPTGQAHASTARCGRPGGGLVPGTGE